MIGRRTVAVEARRAAAVRRVISGLAVFALLLRGGGVIETADCVVIGAGVVGLAVARALARAGRDVLILESADDFGTGTSSRNSEIIHAGIYYPRGSLKQKLCIQGRDMLYAFCDAYRVPYRRTTKLLIAANEDEIPALRNLRAHAAGSGVHMTMLTAADAVRLEPQLRCAAALHSPLTGIIDSHAYMLALLGDLEAHGGTVAYGSTVTGGRITDHGVEVTVNSGMDSEMRLACRLLINSAGLWAQDVSRAIAGVAPESIPPVHYAKGNYFYLSGKQPFTRLIYPLPNHASLGVHYTLDLSSQGRFGPDIEWVNGVDYAVDERRADSFYDAVRKYWPDIQAGSLRPGYCGIRPKVQAPGEPHKDFVIQTPPLNGGGGYVALYGIESPGLTSSLAIANHVAEQVGAG